MKEAERFVVLLLSLLLALVLLPIQIFVMVLNILGSVVKITVDTLNNLIESIHKEVNK